MSNRREFLTGSAATGLSAALSALGKGADAPGIAITDARVQALLESSLERRRVPGASIAVFSGGKIALAASGVANVATGVPITPDTVMHIGSITKVFTATLIMQLADEGKVDLDERIVKYLPDLQLREKTALTQITVKMLLNHTSGIDGNSLPDHGHDEETIEKGIARCANLVQLFAPGTELSYCNVSLAIAGYLAQRVAGKSWYQLIRDKIAEPLQMKHVATLPEEALLYRASVGHFFHSESQQLVRTQRAFNPLSRAPAGTTLMMSASDLLAFARAHVNGGAGENGARILSPQSAKAMQQITVSNQLEGYARRDIGIGWMISSDGLLQHGGGGQGIVSQLYVSAKGDWAAAVLTNGDRGGEVIYDVARTLLDKNGAAEFANARQLRASRRKPVPDAKRYAGTYEDIYMRYRVAESPEGLTLSRQAKFVYGGRPTEPTPPAPLTPIGNGQFLLESAQDQDDLPAQDRIFTFHAAGAGARMQFLRHTGLFLYPRTMA